MLCHRLSVHLSVTSQCAKKTAKLTSYTNNVIQQPKDSDIKDLGKIEESTPTGMKMGTGRFKLVTFDK